MKKDNVQDERIILKKRKINSDTFGILFYGLLISILLQQFVFNAPFSQYAVEFILFAIASCYVVVRNIMAGNNLFNDHNSGQKMVVFNSLISGISIAITTAALNMISLGFKQVGGISNIATVALNSFAYGTSASFVFWEVFYLINRKRQKQIEDKLNDSEK